MELKTLFVDFSAQLTIDMDDVEVFKYLSGSGFPIVKWILETYHIRDRMTEEKMGKTLSKINLVMEDILKRRKAMLDVKVEA